MLNIARQRAVSSSIFRKFRPTVPLCNQYFMFGRGIMAQFSTKEDHSHIPAKSAMSDNSNPIHPKDSSNGGIILRPKHHVARRLKLYEIESSDTVNSAILSRIRNPNNIQVQSRLTSALQSGTRAVNKLIRDIGISSFSIENIAYLMYKSNRNGIMLNNFLHGIATVINKSPNEIIKNNDLSHCFFGLRNYSSRETDCQALVLALLHRLHNTTHPLSANDISVCSVGWYNLSSNYTAVRQLALDFAAVINGCEEPFSPQNLSTILFNCRLFSSAHIEVQQLLQAITTKAKQCTERFTNLQIMNSLAGLHSMTGNYHVRLLLAALTPLFRGAKDRIEPKNVSAGLYGLKGTSSKSAEVKELLQCLVPSIACCKKEPFNCQQVSMMLSGVKEMSVYDNGVLPLFATMLPFVKSCSEPLDGQGIAMVMAGLKDKVGSYPEVSSMLAALTPLVRDCKEELTGQVVGNALYGLRAMNTGNIEVRHFVAALIPHIARCNHDLIPQEASMALAGFYCMHGSQLEVRQLLVELTKLFTRAGNDALVLDGQGVAVALRGIRRLSSEYEEVRNLLAVLTPMIDKCNAVLYANEVGMSIYGLASLSSEHIEVIRLLDALLPLIRHSEGPLDAQAIGNSLYGLQSMSNADAPQVVDLLRILHDKANDCSEIMCPIELCNAFYGLRKMDMNQPEVVSILQLLHKHLATYRTRVFSKHQARTILKVIGTKKLHNEEAQALLTSLIALLQDVTLLVEM